MFYENSHIEVNSPLILNMTISEPVKTEIPRSYFIEVVHTRDGVDYIKATDTITIPMAAASTIASFSMIPVNVGQFDTTINVYSEQNESLLSSNVAALTNTSSGQWFISVALPQNRNNIGTLALYAANGSLKLTCSALGKSANGTAMNVTNGHTPIGPYTGWVGGPHSPSSSYGPYNVIEMAGASGNAYVPPRYGIWIHGGGNQSTLSATYGCVRIFDGDAWALSYHIQLLVVGGHDTIGNVYIYED